MDYIWYICDKQNTQYALFIFSYKCDNDIHVAVQNGPLEQLRKTIIVESYINESESFDGGDVKENDIVNHISDSNDTRVLRSKTQKRWVCCDTCLVNAQNNQRSVQRFIYVLYALQIDKLTWRMRTQIQLKFFPY